MNRMNDFYSFSCWMNFLNYIYMCSKHVLYAHVCAKKSEPMKNKFHKISNTKLLDAKFVMLVCP